MLFSNRNEFLRDSSRIEPIPPNIRNDILSESGITIGEKKIMKPHASPRIRKKSFVAIGAIRANRGLCGIGV